jgi:hypothetical protein
LGATARLQGYAARIMVHSVETEPREETIGVDNEQLAARLGGGEVVVLPEPEWRTLEASYDVLASHDTGLAGLLQLLRGPGGIVAVEAPKPHERTVRAFGDEPTARQFVADRLARYERMWEG